MRLNSISRVICLALFAPAILIAQSSSREQTADQQVLHVLNRLAFGPRPGDVQKVRAMGVDKWIDEQLKPDKIDDRAMDQFLGQYATLNTDQGQLLAQYTEMQQQRRQVKKAEDMTREDSMMLRQRGQQLRAVVGDLESARIARAVASERQLQEVMTDFWENHFTVYARKGGPMPFLLTSYDRDVIRPHALGKFRDLLEAVAKSPAMLFYLDNARSTVDSTHNPLMSFGRGPFGRVQRPANAQINGLNENYGRELLELHTLGVDGGYTQQDVINVARALTGWTIGFGQQQRLARFSGDVKPGEFVFRPVMHDADEKIVLGHKLRAGRGMEDGEDVLDILARHPATARFIATKLARRFISDNPPQSVIDRAAATFTRTDGDIREVVRTIITSPEFFSASAYRAKVKSPFELVVSTVRALGGQPDATPRTAQAIAYLGEPIFGHQAPNGYPETGDAWMNTGAILNRINFGMVAASGRLPGVDLRSWADSTGLNNPSREAQVDAVIRALLGGAVSPDTRAILLKGENPMTRMRGDDGNADTTMNVAMAFDSTNIQKAVSALPQPPRIRGPRQGGLQGSQEIKLSGPAQTVGLALGSPEFQRR